MTFSPKVARRLLRERRETPIKELEVKRATSFTKARPEPPKGPEDYRPEPPRCPACSSKSAWIDHAGSYGYYPARMGVRCTNDKCGIRTPALVTEDWSREKGPYDVRHATICELIRRWGGRSGAAP
ncbi:hypothetical protein GGR19_001721 [Croceicoccus naphthovorans]|nr:hypothetical protein [Croceicoccus naphthovorans]